MHSNYMQLVRVFTEYGCKLEILKLCSVFQYFWKPSDVQLSTLWIHMQGTFMTFYLKIHFIEYEILFFIFSFISISLLERKIISET